MKIHTLILLPLFLLAGCSTVKSVSPVEAGDSNLSCSSIVKEIEKVKMVRAQAESDKGFSGKNVAAALLFWPAVIGNEMNARDASKAANERIANLSNIYNSKGCK